MLEIGEQTYIRTWNGAGKQSFMPLRWVLDGWAGVDRSNRAGEQVVVTPLGPGNAVSIYSRGYYQKSEVTVVAADTVLTLWGGDPVQASLLRPGSRPDGVPRPERARWQDGTLQCIPGGWCRLRT